MYGRLPCARRCVCILKAVRLLFHTDPGAAEAEVHALLALLAWRSLSPQLEVFVLARAMQGWTASQGEGGAFRAPAAALHEHKFEVNLEGVVFATSYELMRALSLHIPPLSWHVRVLEYQSAGWTALQVTGMQQHGPLSRHAPAARRARAKVEPPADDMDEAFNLAFGRGRQPARKRAPAAAREPTGRASSESEARLSDVVSDMERGLIEELSALDPATARPAEASRGGGAAGPALVLPNEASGGGGAAELPKLDHASGWYMWSDNTRAGHLSAWPKATLYNQRVRCNLHEKCVKASAVTKLPAVDQPWAVWLARGRLVGTAAEHKAEWGRLLADGGQRAPRP